MLIEGQEELKKWLTSHLEPLCDADPQALSKYVLALIKKDKPIEELKSSMISQMDVFLQSETHNFVEMLFKIVDSKEYLNTNGSAVIKEDKDPGTVKEESGQDVEGGGKIEEADSTTPVRDHEKFPDPRPSFDDREDRKRLRGSPPGPAPDRRGGRGGHRDYRDHPPPPPPPPRRYRSRSRSRSGSPRHDRFRSTRRRSRSPETFRRSGGRRGRSQEPRHEKDGTPTRDEAGGYTPTPTVRPPRCRDYDEKGFCLRGDMCKFDHGNDAVVLEDSRGYQPGLPGLNEPYVPGLPGVPGAAGGISYPPPVMSVPPPGYPPIGTKRGHDGGFEPPNKRFDYGRLGGRGRGRGGRGRGGMGPRGHHSSTMLAVRNIPVELNSITSLNSHFSKFGILVNVQIHFEGDPSSALITFAGTSEAAAAFNCTEAIMNNRFIKVFWHIEKPALKERLGAQNTNPNNVVLGERNEEAEDVEKVKEDKEKAIQEIQKSQEMLQSKHEEMKKVEEQRKEALAKQEGLLKSKQDLLDGLIQQQKMLISKLEKGKGALKAEEKTKIMKLLKELTSSIDKTRQDIRTSLAMSGTKTRADLQKELLDAEMEMFTRQQDGEDITDLQQRVESLRREAGKLGISQRPPRGGRGGYRGAAGRGRGYFAVSPRGGGRGRGRGRGFAMGSGSNKLDRRPTSVLVSGFDLEEKEEIMKHFTKFGEVADSAEDESIPSIILKFKSRPVAEAAMTQGKTFQDKELQLSWYTEQLPGKEGDEEVLNESGELEQEEQEDDGYTPPQEDYLPPGLQEHEESLSRERTVSEGVSETAETEELNEHLLDEEEEDEEAENEERSWKRRNNGEE